MSSATVIFILDHIESLLKKGSVPKKYNDIVSLAFGPGLSVEGVMLKIQK
jgi:predicted naringenin-chalcone synthase